MRNAHQKNDPFLVLNRQNAILHNKIHSQIVAQQSVNELEKQIFEFQNELNHKQAKLLESEKEILIHEQNIKRNILEFHKAFHKILDQINAKVTEIEKEGITQDDIINQYYQKSMRNKEIINQLEEHIIKSKQMENKLNNQLYQNENEFIDVETKHENIMNHNTWKFEIDEVLLDIQSVNNSVIELTSKLHQIDQLRISVATEKSNVISHCQQLETVIEARRASPIENSKAPANMEDLSFYNNLITELRVSQLTLSSKVSNLQRQIQAVDAQTKIMFQKLLTPPPSEVLALETTLEHDKLADALKNQSKFAQQSEQINANIFELIVKMKNDSMEIQQQKLNYQDAIMKVRNKTAKYMIEEVNLTNSLQEIKSEKKAVDKSYRKMGKLINYYQKYSTVQVPHLSNKEILGIQSFGDSLAQIHIQNERNLKNRIQKVKYECDDLKLLISNQRIHNERLKREMYIYGTNFNENN